MLPYQQRVVEEKAALDEKLERLDAFIVSTDFQSVPLEEQVRLTRQSKHMADYSAVLQERIDAFAQ